MTKNQIHEWHERLEDGRKQYIRAYWNSREWEFRYAHPDGEHWMPLENPTNERWLELRDLLFRKYQRKKLPWKYVVQLDKKLEAMGIKVEDGPVKTDEEDD